jgi:hypothetical protein
MKEKVGLVQEVVSKDEVFTGGTIVNKNKPPGIN